jgi:hypothetical protein
MFDLCVNKSIYLLQALFRPQKKSQDGGDASAAHPPSIQLAKTAATTPVAAAGASPKKERKNSSSRFSVSKNRELVKLPLLKGILY